MIIESPAFEHHHTIPKKYTCDGENLSPPLTFSDPPTNAKSLVLIMEDPDAPSGTFVHWLAWNLNPATYEILEGSPVPKEGVNGFQETRYKGPCPPKGKPHRYFFKLYALDTTLTIPQGSDKEQLEHAMEGHIVDKSELIGLYGRQ